MMLRYIYYNIEVKTKFSYLFEDRGTVRQTVKIYLSAIILKIKRKSSYSFEDCGTDRLYWFQNVVSKMQKFNEY